jgi:hypothetical protein
MRGPSARNALICKEDVRMRTDAKTVRTRRQEPRFWAALIPAGDFTPLDNGVVSDGAHR